MSKMCLRRGSVFLLPLAFLFANVIGLSVARGQAKTGGKAKTAPAKITLRDADYAALRAAHPSDAYLGTTFPALSAGKTEKREFQMVGAAVPSAPLVVQVTPIVYATGEKPKPLPTFEKTLLPFAKARENFTLDFPVPKTDVNVTIEYTLSVRQKNAVLASLKETFVVMADGKAGTRVQWLGRDDKTQGDWLGVYGKEAFLVATQRGLSVFQNSFVALNRGLGTANAGSSGDVFDSRNAASEGLFRFYARADSLADKRLPQYGPGQSETRPPVAFAAQNTPLIFRVEASDGLPHTLSLYVLDYERVGQVQQADVYDFQRHRLDTQKIEKFGEGAYLRYHFSGKIIVVIHSRTLRRSPVVHALFVDP